MQEYTPKSISIWRAFLNYLVEFFMMITPQDPLSNKIKRILLGWRGATIGKKPKIWRDVWVDEYRHLTIGDNVSIGKSVMLLAIGGITVGDNVMIGHGAQIISAGHRIPEGDTPMRFSGVEHAPIVIESDAWIGAGAIVLPGVTVGQGAVVAAGAVVTHDVDPLTIVGGIPANVLRVRQMDNPN